MVFMSIGVINLIFGFVTLFIKKDPLSFSWNKKIHLKNEKGFIRFQGINYIICAFLCLIFWLISIYTSSDLLMPVLVVCGIGSIFYYKYRKRYLL